MKRAAVLVGAALLLAGCSSAAKTEQSVDHGGIKTYTFNVDTPNGVVLCIFAWSGIYNGGPSCDWDHPGRLG